MNILALGGSVILQQWLAMLPTGQGAHPLPDLGGRDIDQAIPRAIPKDSSFHVGGFELASSYKEFAVRIYQRLGNVE